jgi:hypothetical protein
MAKTSVSLKVDGLFQDVKDQKREVLDVTYSFNRATDPDGLPAGQTKGGKIVLKLKALNNENSDLSEWIFDRSKGKNGSIEFMDPKDNTKKMKSIDFENAYCIEFTEHWEEKTANQDGSTSQDVAHYEQITLSCEKITRGLASYQNESWTV